MPSNLKLRATSGLDHQLGQTHRLIQSGLLALELLQLLLLLLLKFSLFLLNGFQVCFLGSQQFLQFILRLADVIINKLHFLVIATLLGLRIARGFESVVDLVTQNFTIERTQIPILKLYQKNFSVKSLNFLQRMS